MNNTKAVESGKSGIEPGVRLM